MQIAVEGTTSLEFDDGSPVRAASAIARLGDGWLVAQDDATHAAWWRGSSVSPIRVLPAVDGHETFDEEAGTKHLKPDLEAACEVLVAGRPMVLLLGSGSSEARMRCALLGQEQGRTDVVVADLAPLYAAVAAALSVTADELNLEGACVVGEWLRWFHRGLPSAGLPSASVDLDLEQVVSVVRGDRDAEDVQPRNVVHHDLGEVAGVGLAATDAVLLRAGAEPLLLVAAAAEDTPNARDDGPVVGSALVVIQDTGVVASIPLPEIGSTVAKVEGLALVEQTGSTARLLATVDADDRSAASVALHLRLHW